MPTQKIPLSGPVSAESLVIQAHCHHMLPEPEVNNWEWETAVARFTTSLQQRVQVCDAVIADPEFADSMALRAIQQLRLRYLIEIKSEEMFPKPKAKAAKVEPDAKPPEVATKKKAAKKAAKKPQPAKAEPEAEPETAGPDFSFINHHLANWDPESKTFKADSGGAGEEGEVQDGAGN